jgi:hypothetical protein
MESLLKINASPFVRIGGDSDRHTARLLNIGNLLPRCARRWKGVDGGAREHQSVVCRRGEVPLPSSPRRPPPTASRVTFAIAMREIQRRRVASVGAFSCVIAGCISSVDWAHANSRVATICAACNVVVGCVRDVAKGVVGGGAIVEEDD